MEELNDSRRLAQFFLHSPFRIASAEHIEKDEVGGEYHHDAQRVPSPEEPLFLRIVDEPSDGQAGNGQGQEGRNHVLALDGGEERSSEIEYVVEGQDKHIEDVAAENIADGQVDGADSQTGSEVDMATKILPTNVRPSPVIAASRSAIEGRKSAAPTTTAAWNA